MEAPMCMIADNKNYAEKAASHYRALKETLLAAAVSLSRGFARSGFNARPPVKYQKTSVPMQNNGQQQ